MTSGQPLILNPDRLFPPDEKSRDIARHLYQHVKDLPIISPHGHTDPRWFAENHAFENATELLIKPDHYVLRMLYSQGISFEQLGIYSKNGRLAEATNSETNSPETNSPETNSAKAWQCFADNYHLFRGTPTRLWCDHVFAKVFGIDSLLDSQNAQQYFETINKQLATPAFTPRALFERFNIELLATTESPLDTLSHHQQIASSDWGGRVITTFRPDPVIDPNYTGFIKNIQQLAALTGESIDTFAGYLRALAVRRQFFIHSGATATDHGHPTAFTADLASTEAAQLYQVVKQGKASAQQAELFRGQMLTEMAKMSIDDGLVMQIHPGVYRNHNSQLFKHFGRDKGADIPIQTDYVQALRPLLTKYGNQTNLTIIVFTLDETTYSRELAPLAGHYPALKVGPAWWFNDSPEGMRRYREQMTETAGFYNTVGFNDDTRAFLSIPARHDVARRVDCAYLAKLVAQHQMPETEAIETAIDLSYHLAKRAYKL